MVIQHNIPAINSHRNLLINNNATAKNLEKLSSGYRINRAGDDAAGLAISEKMRGQIRGLAKAEDNASHAINLIQTAEGGLQETHAILQRMRELAVQASNGTYQDDDRKNIALEVDALKSEIDRIASATEYNGMKLLDGTLGGIKASTAQAADWTNIGGLTAAKTLILETTHYGLAGSGVATLVVNSDGTASLTVNDKTYYGKDATGATKFYEIVDGQEVHVATLNASVTTSAGVVSGIDLAATVAGTAINTGANVQLGWEAQKVQFQIGANGTADQRVGLYVFNMSSGAIGSKGEGNKIAAIDISTRADANLAIDIIDDAINQVSGQRAELGALQNRLEHTLNNLGVTKENLTAAESTIRDVDMAKEMMEFTKNSILVQASQAMLAQANALPQGVLSLLG